MPLELPRIYPITDRRLSGLSHSEQVRRLINAGATLIQLREKSAAASEWFDDAANALEIARSFSVTLLINDRVDIAMMLGADGVHLGQNDISPADARKMLGPDAIIGFSTHSAEQVSVADGLLIDYLAFGPVSDTATKADHDPVTGIAKLKQIRDLSALPLVAIGGISADNCRSAIDAGADSCAVISAVLSGGDIERNFAALTVAIR